jgi:hypothetical protein
MRQLRSLLVPAHNEHQEVNEKPNHIAPRAAGRTVSWIADELRGWHGLNSEEARRVQATKFRVCHEMIELGWFTDYPEPRETGE